MYHQGCRERTKIFTENCWDPQNVVDQMVHAVTQRRPRPQYLVGLDAKFQAPAISMLPRRMVDMFLNSMYHTLRPAAAQSPRKGGSVAGGAKGKGTKTA